jgi:N-acetylmuramoyl-L-alanine amidase
MRGQKPTIRCVAMSVLYIAIEHLRIKELETAIAMKRVVTYLIFVALMLGGCSPFTTHSNVATEREPSPNHDERRPNFVIIHHAGSSVVAEALRTLTDPQGEVSSHYVIGRDGTVYQLVDERARAWHAGDSQWGGMTDINSASLGIELDNNGTEPFPDVQISALLELLTDIQRRYHIPTGNFLGHADIAPKRKTDPSRYFPWQLLAQHGFGIWCDPLLATPPPPSFDIPLALRALGYDVSDVGAAMQAFVLHFVHDDVPFPFSEGARAMLWCLATNQTGQTPEPLQ